MEALHAYSDDSQVHGQPVPRANFVDEVSVVFKVHGSRSAAAVIAIAKSDGGIEGVAGIVEYRREIPDIHVLVAVCPFGARDRLVTGRFQFLNLFRCEMRRLHGSIFLLRSIKKELVLQTECVEVLATRHEYVLMAIQHVSDGRVARI